MGIYLYLKTCWKYYFILIIKKFVFLFPMFRCFGNALGNCILNKEYLLAINKIPKQVRINI